MTPDELATVEAEVNAYVRQNTPVETRIMTPEAAQRLGARALFGEKYGDEVRVVAMGASPGSKVGPDGDTYSLELCGGTHVRRTGDIGAFKLVSEGASASGIRRIEALTGEGAMAHVAAEETALAEAASLLRARPEDLPERIRTLLDERKAQAAELAELRRRLALAGGPAEAKGPETVAGVPFLARKLVGVSGKDLRGLIDEHKARLGSGVVLLVADTGDKAAVAAGVTNDLTSRISAVDLVRVAAEALGGKGGGGRPDMAQAGGADPARAPQAIAAARALLEA
jgi:alanyl-tRNA synthetase